ncbi:MAG TPA: hypothetical protein VGG19_07190, partial [Tepidisphaeraceae bacterium]
TPGEGRGGRPSAFPSLSTVEGSVHRSSFNSKRSSHIALKIFVLVLINLAIVVPWLFLVEHRSPGFLARILGHDLLQRMHEPLEGHKGPPGFYLLTIFATFYPWSIFLPLIVIRAWRHRHEPHIQFALAAVIGPWLMFECISTKMVHYVLPIFPPLAFLLADVIVRTVRKIQKPAELAPSPCTQGEGRGGGGSSFILHPSSLDSSSPFIVPRSAFAIWSLITTAIATALILPDRWFPQIPLWPGVIIVLVGLAYAIFVLSLFWKGRLVAGINAMGIGFAIFVIALFALYLPQAEFLRISPNLADILNARHIQSAGMIGYEEESLAFYDAGEIDSLPSKGLHESPQTWPPYIVISSDVYDRLPPTIQNHLTILARTTGINYTKSIKPIEVFIAQKTP